MEFPEVDNVATEHTTQQARTVVRRSLRTGFKLVIPFLVTMVVIGIAVGFLFRVLTPAVRATELVSGGSLPLPLIKALTVVVLLSLVFLVGFVANRRSGGSEVAEQFDETMGAIPGAGSVYSSSRRMSDILIDDDSRSFREVKIVEYPSEGVFALGFLTDGSPDVASDVSGDELRALFVPFSPNPFMGGFLVYVPEDRLHDIDMSVKQAVSTIMTSGVTGTTDDASSARATAGQDAE